ncbi:MAG TPA: thrombospondin type 3 repeat-containing protein [Ramlibacter sp.]|nr:thrombospondin type 3 repeat-containing protein [Ramlibacter sp.]
MKSLLILTPLAALLSGCVAYGGGYSSYGYGDPNVYVSPGAAYGGVYGGPVYRDRDQRRGWSGRASGDRDRDGVPNRYDRDRDGDGVPNRYDNRPYDPSRR